MHVRHPQFAAAATRDNAYGRFLFFSNISQLIAVCVILPAIVGLAGCEEPRAPVFPVRGKVTFQGKPAAGAKVVLSAVKPNDIDVIAPTGEVHPDGTFEITSYDIGDGAPSGDYVATVVWFKKVGEAAGPNVLPKAYGSPSTSPVKVSVSGPTDIPPIAIK